MSFPQGPFVLDVPEPEEGKGNPGDIDPGEYSLQDLVELLRTHKGNAEVIQFIADMMEA